MGELISGDFGRDKLIERAVTIMVDFHRVTNSSNMHVTEDYMSQLSKKREDALAPLTDEERQTAEEVARDQIEEIDQAANGPREGER